MRKQSTGLFALLLVGGYYAWRNRSGIMNFFEENGIKLPFLDHENETSADTIRSGVSKVGSSLEHGINHMSDQRSKAV